MSKRFWLWRHRDAWFGDHWVAFDCEYPVHPDGGDPCVLGEPEFVVEGSSGGGGRGRGGSLGVGADAVRRAPAIEGYPVEVALMDLAPGATVRIKLGADRVWRRIPVERGGTP